MNGDRRHESLDRKSHGAETNPEEDNSSAFGARPHERPVPGRRERERSRARCRSRALDPAERGLMSTHLGRIARFEIAWAVAATFLGASVARAQAPLWPDAPWRAFVTGSYPEGFIPISLAAGDLDGDGDLDVLVGQFFFGGPGVSVLKNLGDGTYLPPVYYALAQDRSVGEVALADFDGDGDLDAFATIRGVNDDQAKLLVWRNNGAGTLAAPVEFTTGLAPVGIVVDDFTGDGKPDVATANYAFGAQDGLLPRAQRANGRRRRFPAQNGHRARDARRGSGRRRHRRRRPPGSRGGRVPGQQRDLRLHPHQRRVRRLCRAGGVRSRAGRISERPHPGGAPGPRQRRRCRSDQRRVL